MPVAHNAPSSHPEKALIWRILDHLRDRRFEPGERLPSERDLAERLGVGRNALREALATLITLRVVESRPNSGIYLRKLASESSFETVVLLSEMGSPPSPADVIDTMEVRRTLELQAVQLACERRTEEDLARIAATLRDADALLAQKGNIADCDNEFHMALAEASHNTVLVRLLHAFYRLSLERRRDYFSDLKRAKDSANAHRKIAEAIEKRDVEAGMKIMERHIGNGKHYWSEILKARTGN
jgi:DNA-binding FadR family transcriptional regulator